MRFGRRFESSRWRGKGFAEGGLARRLVFAPPESTTGLGAGARPPRGMTASSSTMRAMESRRSAQRSDGLLECGRLSVTTSLCTRSSAAGPRCRLCPMRPHRRPPTKQHLRLPHRPQAFLQLPRGSQAKRHAHSSRAPAPMLPRRRPPMLGRCPLWPLATLSCSAPRRCATRA